MRLLMTLSKQIRYWDMPSRWALALAVVLFGLVIILGLTAEEDERLPFLLGAIGLFIAMQVITMWGNRHMVTPYYAAQRAYLEADFEGAKQHLLVDIADHEAQGKSAPVDTLVLLGNIHRQLGELVESANYLKRAVELEPEYHFPLYGYGRTLLVMADYANASMYMQRALENGAPSTIRADIAHAFYRAGDAQSLANWLEGMPTLEPYRQFMVDWIKHRTEGTPFHERHYPLEAFDFWQAEAQRYTMTAYGQAIYADLAHMAHSGVSRKERE